MRKYSELKKKRQRDKVIMGIIVLIFAVIFAVDIDYKHTQQEIIADNPECILNLKQDYCAIYNMTYGSKVMMTGLLSRNAQTIEICYDNVNEFRLYISSIDVHKCER